MQSENNLTFKYEIKQGSKTALKVLKWIFVMLAAAALIASIALLFTDVPAIAIMTIFVTITFFALAKLSSNQSKKLQLYKTYLEFRENEIYYFYENFTHHVNVEHRITYDKVKTIYLARGSHLVHSNNSTRNKMIYPILIIEWENENEIKHLAQGMNGKELRKVLAIFPNSIPLKALKYDMTHWPISWFPKIIESSNLIDIDRDKSLDLPFQISGRVSSIPAWEPPEQKKEKVDRDKRSKGLANAILGFTVVALFLMTMFALPNVELVDDMFQTEDTMYLDLFYAIILFLFVYLRHSIIYKNLFPIKRVIFHILLISGTFFVAGLLASGIMSVPNGFMDAIMVQAFMSALFVGMTYVIYILANVLWMFIDMFRMK